MLCGLNQLMRLLNLMFLLVCKNKCNKEQERAASIRLNFHKASMTSFEFLESNL